MIARFAFWAALALAVIMALLPQPPSIPGNPSDTFLHILAFAVLAGLAAFAYPQRSMFWQGVALCGLGAGIEFLQLIPALHRDAQFSDWLADASAVVITMLFVSLVRWLQSRARRGTFSSSGAGSGVGEDAR